MLLWFREKENFGSKSRPLDNASYTIFELSRLNNHKTLNKSYLGSKARKFDRFNVDGQASLRIFSNFNNSIIKAFMNFTVCYIMKSDIVKRTYWVM